MELPKFTSISPETYVVPILLLVTTGCALYSAYSLTASGYQQNVGTKPAPVTVQKNRTDSRIRVDIEGAVEKPGLYNVPDTARLVDVLITAGGLSKNADRRSVAKTFNLAKKLFDEDKIYIPFLAEQSVQSNNRETGSVNINTAGLTEIELLPKIGPVTAKKLIEHRPYENADALVSKRVIGEKTLETIRDLITW